MEFNNKNNKSERFQHSGLKCFPFTAACLCNFISSDIIMTLIFQLSGEFQSWFCASNVKIKNSQQLFFLVKLLDNISKWFFVKEEKGKKERKMAWLCYGKKIQISLVSLGKKKSVCGGGGSQYWVFYLILSAMGNKETALEYNRSERRSGSCSEIQWYVK